MQACLASLLLVNMIIAIWASAQVGGSGFENTTIYTQAVDDWNGAPWIDFELGDGRCKAGWHTFGIQWGGTFRGNFSGNEIIPI